MNLREALKELSKSSPSAVTTDGEIADAKIRAIKDYLYVETDVEIAFRGVLERLENGSILFLCGSSGDGKSEILTRYKKSRGDKVKFHLDATHSFEPDHTAIDTLNLIFDEHDKNKIPLVVGINVGMLANYEREGAEKHHEIRKAISKFLAQSKPTGNKIHFIHFEDYPKFSLDDGRVSSPFFRSLINKIVVDDHRNPFRDLFNAELAKSKNLSNIASDRVLTTNYLLLRDMGVQKAIIELIFNARIRKDQFITARMVLDFVFSILAGEDYLFDNVFNGGDNDLLLALSEFDPSLTRTVDVDRFILNQSLGIEDQPYLSFMDETTSKFGIENRILKTPKSKIRMLFLVRHSNLNNNYPAALKKSFTDDPEIKYREIWSLHHNYCGDQEDKKKLKVFYENTVFSSIQSYANRNAPYLSKDEFYLSSQGKIDIASELEMTVAYKDIESEKYNNIYSFNLHINIAGKKVDPIPVNVNLMELMINIVNGFRPNRYDKNSVVLLDELVSHIYSTLSNSDTLFLYKKGARLAKLKHTSDDEIRVSGLNL
ncbi:MAG: DNA phosphorothioation-dependent restriction protein DptF [Gammaproteobacteria bacterium]|nr:DNA phosphorothioation-dependent restriction protein DptF [Gammaproteobacteria bacterium]